MKKNGFVSKGKFAAEEAKLYFIAAIIMFHILPIVFVFIDGGQAALYNVFMFTANPLFMFALTFVYGLKLGFEWKFPLIYGAIAVLSIIMYYSFENSNYMLLSAILCFITYTLFSYIGTFVGALAKKFISLD